MGSTEFPLKGLEEEEGWGMGRLWILEVNSVRNALSRGRPAVAELSERDETKIRLDLLSRSRAGLDSLL